MEVVFLYHYSEKILQIPCQSYLVKQDGIFFHY